MPKSRGRKPRKSSKKSSTRRGTASRARSGWGEFEPWARAMVMADEAEARGDAMAALDVMEAFMVGPDGKDFWRLSRMKRLLQIASLAAILPAWATSRWICSQALQCLHDDSRERIRRAFDLTVELRGGLDQLPGVDSVDARARVVDGDWVYRQLFLYEFGGLEFFVRRIASSTLLAGADSIHDWARAPMGGYALLDCRPGIVTWLDLASGERHQVANIGSAVFVGPGEHVIGRLVPTDQGRMFESQPLLVPERVARAVSEHPGDWLEELRTATTSRDDKSIVTHGRHVDAVVSDVPALVWQLALLGDKAVPNAPDAPEFEAQLARAILDACARELEHQAPRSAGEVDVWACLGAALLEPYVVAALPEVWRAADRRLFQRLGDLLARPASDLCLAAVETLSEAA